MALDVEFLPEVLRVKALNLVRGEEGTRTWEGTMPVPRLTTTPAGLMYDGKFDRHYGLIRTARGYQLPEGWATDVANDRQVGIVVEDDLEHIMNELDIASLLRDIADDPFAELGRLMAANVVLEVDMYEDKKPSDLMITGAQLCIGASASEGKGTILKLSGPHNACGKVVTALCGALSLDRAEYNDRIKSAMAGRRGYMASVFMAGIGMIHVGDEVRIQPPIPSRVA